MTPPTTNKYLSIDTYRSNFKEVADKYAITQILNHPYTKYTMRTTLAICFVLLFTNMPLKNNGSNTTAPSLAEEIEQREENAWVEQKFNSLSQDEKIGQLFMIRAHSDKGYAYEQKVLKQIQQYHVGGVIFFQGTPSKQGQLTNQYQAASSKVPLMVAMDAEWGLGMRLKQTISYPRQLMLGAIQDNVMLYDMGREVARQARRLGVHVNFAPVVDVNNNPNNPVIGDRSFGEDKHNVTAKSYMYMKGMQDGGLLACAKHFPGHGDTDVDSHVSLPVITHGTTRLNDIELYPFKVLSQHGIGSMMVAHLSIPSLDSRSNYPSTLSDKIITNLLKNQIGYEGLIITDGLEMGGVAKHFKNGEVEVKALQAGNDILLLPRDIGSAFRAIKTALANGELYWSDIDKKVKKILAAKYRLDLNRYSPVVLQNLDAELNSPRAKQLKRRLIEESITLVRNRDAVLPIRSISGKTFASVSIGRSRKTDFQKRLSSYATVTHHYTGRDVPTSMVNKVKNKDVVFVSLHNMSKRSSKGYGISASAKKFIKNLQQHTKVVVVVFGSPYSLKYFDDNQWLIEAYVEDKITQDVVAQCVFGALPMRGKLPVTASATNSFNTGVSTGSLNRLQYDEPESVGLDAQVLNQIDGIANEAVRIGATPSCQVLVARKGKVVYNKAFGYHTYAKQRTAQIDDIYDLASVTKIAAGTLAAMKMEDEGKINIYNSLGNYIPMLKGTNKENLVIRDVMAHHAGLKPWIPFYKETLGGTTKKPRPSKTIYSNAKGNGFTIPVANNLYMKDSYVNTVWKQIADSDLRPTKDYKYSDLGFYIMRKLTEEVTKKPFDTYLNDEFYAPLGLQTATFNPLEKHPSYRIPPTEEDNYFRCQTVHGCVHDMGAAMLGGVSGHAGLFASANDVAIIMQMLLNKGSYGGTQFLKPETVRRFTTRHERSTRRGIGFDMLETKAGKSKNFSALASNNTFGHLGFTGICTWADPDNEIIYVFLSNRTFPSMNNWKLNKQDFRPRIQDVIYKAIKHEVQ